MGFRAFFVFNWVRHQLILPISFTISSLVLGQSYANKACLKHMGDTQTYDINETKQIKLPCEYFIWYFATKDLFPEVVVVLALRMDGSPEMWVLPLVWDVYWTGLNEGYWTTLTYILHWTVKQIRWNTCFRYICMFWGHATIEKG